MVTAGRVVLRSQAFSGYVSPPSEHARQTGRTATPKAEVVSGCGGLVSRSRKGVFSRPRRAVHGRLLALALSIERYAMTKLQRALSGGDALHLLAGSQGGGPSAFWGRRQSTELTSR
jgi:hypothetical protein